jgi:hypothetical protein
MKPSSSAKQARFEVLTVMMMMMMMMMMMIIQAFLGMTWYQLVNTVKYQF